MTSKSNLFAIEGSPVYRKAILNKPIASSFLIPVALFFVAVFGGLLIALGSNFLLFIFAGLVGSTFALFLHYEKLVWLMLFLLLFVVGQLLSFAHISQAHWLPYLLGLIFFLKLPMDASAEDSGRFAPPIPLIFFLLVVIFSAILNASPLAQFSVAAKNYFIPWVFCYFVARISSKDKQVVLIWKFFLFAVIAQLPFVLYQNFYLMRTGHGTMDAMVGSFGGDPLRGGASHVMTLFIIIASVGGLILARGGFVSKRLAYAALVIGGASLALSETKIVFVLFPAALLLSSLTERKDRLRAFMRMAVVGFFLAFSVFLSYRVVFWSSVAENRNSVADTLTRIMSSEDKGDRFMNWHSGEFTRSGSLIIWWKENGSRDWVKTAFGHGPGASRISSTGGVGVAAARYPFILTTSTMSAMLWDLGVIGTGLFAMIFLAGAHRSYSLCRKNPDTLAGAVAGACFVGLVIYAITLPYTRDILEHPTLQFFGALLLGLVYKKEKSVRSIQPQATGRSLKHE